MCGCLDGLLIHARSRRSVLSATACGLVGSSLVATGAHAGLASAAGGGSAPSTAASNSFAESAARSREAARPAEGARGRLVLLGTAGGPSFWPDTDRVGIGSAVVIGDVAYMVDCGAGAARRAAEAFSPIVDPRSRRNTQALRLLRALFLTHLHSDHTVDLPALLLYGYFAGLDAPGVGPLQVYGPGRRGQMEPVFSPAGDPRTVPAFAPANPTPGTVDMISLMLQAFATDVNDRMRDSGRRSPDALVTPHDIALPAIEGFRSPNETPVPAMTPFPVFEDDRVRVSAILVDHAPIFPAFAYRFDSDEGSVVFSGDTGPCENLVRLAQGANVLVHEVIVPSYIDAAYPANGTLAQQANRAHLLRAHTTPAGAGRAAAEAGVRTLVLNHFVPGNATDEELSPAASAFPGGRVVIGEDLLEVGLR